jgi:cell division protease FtsH
MEEAPLLKDLEVHHVKIAGKVQSCHQFLSTMIALLPLLLLVGFMWYGFRRSRQAMGRPLQFGENRAKIYDQTTKARVTFADAAGIDEAKAELQE